MRILVLGGTSFVGRAIVDDALRTGAEVTLFGRGKTGTDLFGSLTRLIGDRDTGDYAALGAGSWDAVVDASGYVPRHVDQAMDALGERAGRYLFISSQAVYQLDGVGPGSTEDTPRRPPVRDTEELTNDTYGPLKVACEDDVVARRGPGRQACPPLRWRSRRPTSWPGTASAASRRWTAASPPGKSKRSSRHGNGPSRPAIDPASD